MSGFSAELIDYLEGRITFEEFDKRREQRETEESKRQSSGNGEGEEADDNAQPTTSGQSLGNTGNVEEGVSPVVQQAFASMLEDSIQQQPSSSSDEEEEEGEDNASDSMSYVDDEKDEDYKEKEVVCRAKRQGGRSRRRKKKEEEEEEMLEEEMLEEREQGAEKPSVGDVFALEMELNRENRKMMKERRHRSKLPRALRGLMGEANIRYARGEKDDAILMCMEIIRQAPLAYEPFSTLAMIYEDNEDVDKALQFGLIAAHLNPSDCEEWVKLAEMSLEQGNTRQAVVCYGKAIKYDPSNVRFLWERSNLYMQLGEHKQCMDGYRRILSLLPMESGQDFIQLSKDMAKSYYESNDLPSALGVMEEALARHPDLITHELTNMAAELFIANHQHSKAMKILVQFCGIVLVRDDVRTTDAPSVQMEQMSMKEEEKEKEKGEEAKQEKEKGEEQEEEKKETEATESTTEEVVKEELLGEIKEVEIEDSVPVDIRAKLMVCLIHQQIFKPLEALLTEMMEQSPEEVGDLYLDVAEAYLDQGQYTSALPLLSALVTSEKYNLAVVWLRHAECLKALGHIDNAAESYNRVVLMAPQHLEARLCLSTLHQQLGRPDMALKALEPMYDPDTLAQDSSATQQELKLLLQRSTLLQTQGKVQENIDTMLTMLAMLLKVAMQRARVCARLVCEFGQRHMKLVKLKSVLSDIEDPEAAYQDIMGKASVLSREDWWQLVCRCVCVLCDVQRYKEAELLVDSSMEFVVFYENKAKRKELEFFGLSAAFLDKNYRRAYDYIRLMLMDNVERPQLWNIFNQVTMNSQDQRHHRFCLRLMLKNPENLALCVLCGHNALVSGSFKHALGQYMQAFRTDSQNPLHSLYVGITFFHMASQKFVAKRHPLLVQGFSFLWRYVELRGECQESMYNLGRALHQVGLVHLALHYYHKALRLPAPTLEGISCDQVDLKGEIAFNLSLIYRASGNTEIARQLITTHCII